MIKKIRYIIESIKLSPAIVYTNHFVTVSIFKQTFLAITSIDKLNLRLIRVSQYFFSFNLTIRHKIEKLNVISNALLRLSDMSQSNIKNKVDVLNAFYNYYFNFSNNELRFVTLQNMSAIAYYIILMEMFDNFKQKLKIVYVSDNH